MILTKKIKERKSENVFVVKKATLFQSEKMKAINSVGMLFEELDYKELAKFVMEISEREKKAWIFDLFRTKVKTSNEGLPSIFAKNYIEEEELSGATIADAALEIVFYTKKDGGVAIFFELFDPETEEPKKEDDLPF